jgi:(2Fe-2S) ferredoxin
MTFYDLHVFVCENEREAGNPKGCCVSKGSKAFTAKLKEICKTKGTPGKKIRVNKAGCLDFCSLGAVVVIYPQGVWYRGVTEADAEEVYEKHILKGEVVERLLAKPIKDATASSARS